MLASSVVAVACRSTPTTTEEHQQPPPGQPHIGWFRGQRFGLYLTLYTNGNYTVESGHGSKINDALEKGFWQIDVDGQLCTRSRDYHVWACDGRITDAGLLDNGDLFWYGESFWARIPE